jgi:hypothetical protein
VAKVWPLELALTIAAEPDTAAVVLDGYPSASELRAMADVTTAGPILAFSSSAPRNPWSTYSSRWHPAPSATSRPTARRRPSPLRSTRCSPATQFCHGPRRRPFSNFFAGAVEESSWMASMDGQPS